MLLFKSEPQKKNQNGRFFQKNTHAPKENRICLLSLCFFLVNSGGKLTCCYPNLFVFSLPANSSLSLMAPANCFFCSFRCIFGTFLYFCNKIQANHEIQEVYHRSGQKNVSHYLRRLMHNMHLPTAKQTNSF